jgi:signal transduction histidine kinase
MKGWTIRRRMTAWVSLLMALTLSVFAIGIAYHLYTESVHNLDVHLHQFGSRMLKAVSHGGQPWKDGSDLEGLTPVSPIRVWIQVFNPQGRLTYQSAGFPELAPGSFAGGRAWVALAGERRYRGMDFYGDGYHVRTVTSMSEMDEDVEDLLLLYAVALPVSLAILWLGGFLLVKRALEPLERIATTAERITAENLSERLPVPETRDEIAKLIEVLNHMIERLERGFDYARRFTADASHQIKTPLTIMRGELEAMLQRGCGGCTDEAALLRVIEEVRQLSLMTDRLLFLSRVDAGQIGLNRERVSARDLLAGLLEDFAVLAEEQEIALEVEVPGEIEVVGDVPLLRELFANLLENALRYNRRQGWVGVRAEVVDGVAEIRVANTGKAIPSHMRGSLFHRFRRGGEQPGGHGLGLNIAQEIARVHGGEVVLASSENDRTEFCARLPVPKE